MTRDDRSLSADANRTRALELFASGASLAEAAHGAGFADFAHLNRGSGACSASRPRRRV